jgi:uncharacterized small protein (DUF1192 family)
MDLDDLEPRKQPPKPKDLSGWGIEELETYIARLEAEIARAREAIKGKRAQKNAADSFFRKP